MTKIALPKKIEFLKGAEKNQQQVVIEPCYPGYGTTLGNTLRRVLLSSLPGAAVVGVKIKGADHEFMTLPHVKEDVLEIMLTLKELRLKIFTDEVIKLELNVKGEKKITAGDISPNGDVEIVNPELIIANITDMAGNLDMEIFASKGVGYEMVEGREKEKHETGYIEIDSIFTPVLSVGIDIENIRVGKMTNWDKLILNIETDGTITPEEAFAQSTNILINQFGALLKQDKEEEKEEKDINEKDSKKNTTEDEIKDEGEQDEEDHETKPKKRGRPKKSE